MQHGVETYAAQIDPKRYTVDVDALRALAHREIRGVADEVGALVLFDAVVTPSFYTLHTYYFAEAHIANRGKERAEYISPMRDAIEKGLRPKFRRRSAGSDVHVVVGSEPYNREQERRSDWISV